MKSNKTTETFRGTSAESFIEEIKKIEKRWPKAEIINNQIMVEGKCVGHIRACFTEVDPTVTRI